MEATCSGDGGATINSKEFLKFQADQEQFATQCAELYMHYLGCDLCAGEIGFDKEIATNTTLQAKLDSILRGHGDPYIDVVQPRLIHSKLAILTCHGTGFDKMICSCITTSPSAKSPPLIVRSLSVALPFYIVQTPTC
jgi:hypothetical protein